MIKLYRETQEFGEYGCFDTESGRFTILLEQEYLYLKRKISSKDIFEGNCQTHTFFPRRIYFQITRRCNLLCPYCFIKADCNQHDVPSDIVLQMASYFGKMGLMEVRLTGGEPTIVKDFPTIVDAFQRENIYVSVSTNGLWSKPILNYFCSCPNLWLIVSIDGEENIHNKYRSDSYHRILSNLKYLRSCNSTIRIRINTVLTTENVTGIESIFQLAHKINAESITFIPLRPQVRENTMHDLFLRAEQFQQALREMIRLKEKYEVDFTTTIETIYKEYIFPDAVFKKGSSCAAGREGANLDFDFYRKEFIVYGCSYSPASDLTENPHIRAPFLAGAFPFDQPEKFGKIWEDDACWEIYRDLGNKSEECRTCQYYRNRCTGSCPIQNIDFSALNLQKNILEQIKNQMKKNGEWYCYKNFL